MKVLLLGKTGQLGWELQRTLQPLGDVVAFGYPEIDMANEGNIRAVMQKHRPDVVVNATAYTAVDQAESEQEVAYAVNAVGPHILAEEARQLNALLVHFSTDYVFDGLKNSPYVETDAPNPLNIYGKSKLAGEQAIQAVGGAHLILRTSWVYSTHGESSFVTKVLQWARKNKNLKIVSDQISNPTCARMLAETTSLLIAKFDTEKYSEKNSGVYHLAGSGYTSRFEWAQQIIKNDPRQNEQIVSGIEAARTQDFPSPAQRPLFSALDCTLFEKTFALRLPEWKETLQLAME
jgi:dTDP-4-dehydrorhamnose reductase